MLSTNPWRVPQWRWLRAVNITEGGPGTTARRDTPDGFKWISRARRFKTLRDAAATERLLLELSLDESDIFWAHYAWLNENSPVKWAIEAHLLARETNREIGFRTGCAESIVDAYENLFFNVREKLNYREYVINVVLRDSVNNGLNERNPDLLWKLFGYCGGPLVLDAMIGRLVNPMWASRPDDVPMFFQDAALNLMKKKAAVSALTVPVSASTQLHLIEAFVKYVEIERTTDTMGKAQDQILGNINAMLAQIPFNIGSKVGAHKDSPLREWDESAIELSSAEMMQVAAGQNLPGYARLRHLEFPEREVQDAVAQ